jgi:hypothetical protein
MAQEKLWGQFVAWMRQGAKDLYNAIVPALPQSVRSIDEPGTPLNPTQQMVTNDLGESYHDYVGRQQAQVRETTERGLER